MSNNTASQWEPIMPIPDEISLSEHDLGYHNKKFGCSPSAQYTYRDRSGALLGYITRWDVQADEQSKKETRPYLYGQDAMGQRGWKSQGFLNPRPLYNLNLIEQKPNAPILICEGEKTAEAAVILFPDCVATTSMCGAQSPHKTDWSPMKDRDIVLSLDFDEPGEAYGRDVYELCQKAGARSIQRLPASVFEQYTIVGGQLIESGRELLKGYDLADALEEGWTAERIKELETILEQKGGSLFVDYPLSAVEETPQEETQSQLHVVTLAEFLNMELQPREDILSPWLQTQSLSMVYAIRGVGKTHFALGLAWAVASGGEFLGWKALQPRGVLYIDGEMPANALQERLTHVYLHSESQYIHNFRILTPDLQKMQMPNLATEEGQERINELLTPDIKLIIVDNISCLARGVRENEGQSWDAIGEWALQMRQKGISILFVHHAGKNGEQRGTSRKEDILDVVLKLKHPTGYDPEQGARFEVHFEKARHLMGQEVKPFVAQLADKKGDQYWETKPLEESNRAKIIELHNDGLSTQEISNALGVNRSTVHRHLKGTKERKKKS